MTTLEPQPCPYRNPPTWGLPELTLTDEQWRQFMAAWRDREPQEAQLEVVESATEELLGRILDQLTIIAELLRQGR